MHDSLTGKTNVLSPIKDYYRFRFFLVFAGILRFSSLTPSVLHRLSFEPISLLPLFHFIPIKLTRGGCYYQTFLGADKVGNQWHIHSGALVSSDVLNVTIDVDVDDEVLVLYNALDKQSSHIDIISQTRESKENSNRASVGLIMR
ncbi:hypothetical protein L2E82_10632 [Cichorium intybus]|uniref:Uncharacterized protein n=1 Tax=Cichorium intybus TaxID=13427 RepID=A0ACB9GB77_CICIN|nr:hypothetical protein L2E82_10632 [Cichorium intybus]